MVLILFDSLGAAEVQKADLERALICVSRESRRRWTAAVGLTIALNRWR